MFELTSTNDIKIVTTAPLPRQEVLKGARLKAADAGTWKLQAGPNSGSEHPKGLARAALEVEAYRLRPEGLPPEVGHGRC